MAKSIGLLLGGLMLVDGLNATVQPRYSFRIWDRIRGHFPESWDTLTREYACLSDRAIRYIAVSEVVMGALMVWLASEARE